MESYEILKDVLKTTSAKQIASEMGLSLSLIYRWTETPPVGSNPNSVNPSNNPLDRVDQLLKATRSTANPFGDTRLAQWVCERAAGFYVHNPESQTTHGGLIPATNDIVQEFADMLREIAIASADQKITDEEAKTIRRRWEELKSVTEGFVCAAEHGNFSHTQPLLSPDIPTIKKFTPER